MGSFGDPIQGGGGVATGTAPAQAGEPQVPDTPMEVVDENDPRLVSEALDVDTGKDAYVRPSVPPDSKYRAKLKLEGIKKENGEKKDYVATQTKKAPVIPYFETAISASIIDPSGRFDGVTLYPQFGGRVGTLVQKDHSSKVTTILSKIKRPDGKRWTEGVPAKQSQLEWIQLFAKALVGEPEVIIETEWEWSCAKCAEEAKAINFSKGYPNTVRGMNKFKPEQDAAKRKLGDSHSPEMQCQVNPAHGYTRAFAKIARFYSLDEAKPGQ